MNPGLALEPVISVATGINVFRAFTDEVTIHLSGRQTGGKFCMFSIITSPGGGPPPHWHKSEDEWFHVLEGRASFFRDGTWTEVPAGTSVFMPRGTVHAYKNVGDTPLKQLVHTSPAGFETFYARCAEEFARPDFTMERIVQISAEHDIFYSDVT